MKIGAVANFILSFVRAFLVPIMAFYNGALWAKEKAAIAQTKANEKVNKIHNRVRRDRARRMRDKK